VNKKREYVTAARLDDGFAFIHGPFTLDDAVENLELYALKEGREILHLAPIHPKKKEGRKHG